jgi:hypothetical protein
MNCNLRHWGGYFCAVHFALGSRTLPHALAQLEEKGVPFLLKMLYLQLFTLVCSWHVALSSVAVSFLFV